MDVRRPRNGDLPRYYARYVERVPDGDVVATLEGQLEATLALAGRFAPDREEHRYAPAKWTVREVIGHCVDAERVFALRALWFARGAPAQLPGFEENGWAAMSNAGARPLAELADEWRAVRRASVLLFRGLDDRAWTRRGIANGLELSAASVAWIMAGHELHHRAVLEDFYLPAS